PSADKYEVKVSAALKLPDDAKPELDPADPMWGRAKEFAHKHGLTQAAFEQAVDLVAARDTITRTQVERARNAELGKLGAGAKVRLDAIEGFYKDLVGPEGAALLSARLWTAGDIVMHERIIAKFKGQGMSIAPRPAPGISDEEWSSMSPG